MVMNPNQEVFHLNRIADYLKSIDTNLKQKKTFNDGVDAMVYALIEYSNGHYYDDLRDIDIYEMARKVKENNDRRGME